MSDIVVTVLVFLVLIPAAVYATYVLTCRAIDRRRAREDAARLVDEAELYLMTEGREHG